MLLPAVVLALLMLPAPGPTPTVATHDNRLPAGVTRDGTLRLDLEIVRGDWYPNGADRAGANVLVFAERGHGPTTPGPLVRARAGTSIAVSMHNTTDDTLAIHGLTSKIGLAAFDSVVVLPGASRSWTFIAETEGSYLYWGARPGTPLAEQLYDDAQLNGALIVDPATGAIPADRIMVIDSYTDGKLPNGDPDLDRELLVVNGRPWPDTERLQYAVGDSIRWRVLNASVAPHPMHLHGFYFRVDGRGDWRRDTLYSDAERRMAVTELLKPGQSMHLTWSPNRPGGWLFHCHLSYHVLPNPPLGAEFTNGDS
ncbi:MAG: multicopper oxidase domain-containing protein, partial [Gemmatimonadota bacterium]